MAFLLGWISLDGRPLPANLWAGLVQRARGRTLNAGMQVDLGHARLYAAAQRAQEPAPLSRLRVAGGSWGYLLRDAAGGSTGRWDGSGADPHSGGVMPPGASAWVAEATVQAVLRRDLAGQRSLHYAQVEGTLLFATGADVLLAHPGVSAALHEQTVAAYLADAPPPEQASMFRDIAVLAPGGELKVAQGRIDHRRVWLRPDDSWYSLRDEDIVEKTHALIQDAVVRACEGASRIGVALSAGLDSSTLAAIAVRHVQALTAVTYGFDDRPDLDERPEVSAFARTRDIDLRAFAADRHGSYAAPEMLVANPDFPCTTPFRRMADRIMGESRQAGAVLCLDGSFAEHLHANPRDAWSDAIRMRRPAAFLAELRRVLRVHGTGVAVRHPGWRRLASRLLRPPHTQALLGARLREPWRSQLRERMAAEQAKYLDFPRPEQAAFALDGTAANTVPREQFHAARMGLELRMPFRDPALMAWMLSLPADFSYRDGHRKWVQRACMQKLLPDDVCWRPKRPSPQAFLVDSLKAAECVLAQRRAAAREWLEAFIEPCRADGIEGDPYAPWLDAEFGYWLSAAGQVKPADGTMPRAAAGGTS